MTEQTTTNAAETETIVEQATKPTGAVVTRIISNPAIREAQRAAREDGKRLSRKKQLAKKKAEARRMEKESRELEQFARNYIAKQNQNQPRLNVVLSEQVTSRLAKKFRKNGAPLEGCNS